MFKYVKNLNGSHATPDCIEIPIASHETVEMGSLGCFFETGVEFYNGGKMGGSYVTVEPKKNGDGKTYVKAIKALPGMVFEVPLTGYSEESIVGIGSLLSSRQGSGANHTTVCADPGDYIEVIGMDDYEKTGNILVTFI